jgi:hypothetical protein
VPADDYFNCLDLLHDPSVHHYQELPQRRMTVTMNASDLQQLKENYANMIIDGMDMDSLCQMAFDLLLDAYKDCSEDDIKEEILDLYDEEMLEDLMPTEAS